MKAFADFAAMVENMKRLNYFQFSCCIGFACNCASDAAQAVLGYLFLRAGKAASTPFGKQCGMLTLNPQIRKQQGTYLENLSLVSEPERVFVPPIAPFVTSPERPAAQNAVYKLENPRVCIVDADDWPINSVRAICLTSILSPYGADIKPEVALAINEPANITQIIHSSGYCTPTNGLAQGA